MDDDWDIDETPVQSGSSNPLQPASAQPPVPVPRAPARGKWEGEDEDEGDDDWDKSEDEKPKATTTTAAPPKKKMTLKQKLAEKERLAQEKLLAGDDEDELIPTMTEQDRRRLAREREIEADLDAANDLFGDIKVKSGVSTPGANGTASQSELFTGKPKTKEDFNALAKLIVSEVTSRHTTNPLYAAFVESLAKELCEELTAVQTRKVSSALSVLGNTKQAEERDKASGKKKTAAGKPKLGGAKTINRVDTEAYDDVLEDDDFM